MKKRNFKAKKHRDWRQLLLNRDKGCIICGETKNVQAHHLVPACKKYREYEFDVDNGVMLCPMHHMWGIMSAHKNPIWFVCWLEDNRQEQFILASCRIEEKNEV